jgi:hypothetical protein
VETHRIELPVMTIRETLEPAGLNDVRQAAVAEVRRLLTETDRPDGDLTPFLLLGDHEGVHALTPSLRDPSFFDEQLKFFVEEVAPLVLAQRHAISAALVLTVWTLAGPAARGLRAGEHPDRQEAVTVMMTDARGAQETMLANISRHRFSSPTVDRFKTVSHGVQPHVAEAFERGFAGLG